MKQAGISDTQGCEGKRSIVWETIGETDARIDHAVEQISWDALRDRTRWIEWHYDQAANAAFNAARNACWDAGFYPPPHFLDD